MKSNLKTIRTQIGYTQEELAQMVGSSRQTIYAIETGKFYPSMVLGLKLAHVLATTVYELFELEDADWHT